MPTSPPRVLIRNHVTQPFQCTIEIPLPTEKKMTHTKTIPQFYVTVHSEHRIPFISLSCTFLPPQSPCLSNSSFPLLKEKNH